LKCGSQKYQFTCFVGCNLTSNVNGRTYAVVGENRALRRICGPKRDEVTGGWRKLHYEELHSLYSSPNTVEVIKLGRMKWVGHVARFGG
jgi:hypothetical protein